MHTLPLDDHWRDTLAALEASPGQAVLVTGEEPLWREDLEALLQALDDADLRAVLHTDLPGLDDDAALRPFAPFDVHFRIRIPSLDPDTYQQLCERPLEQVLFGMRNLQAFAYPFDIEVPVRRETVPTLADTIEQALSNGRTLAVRLRLDAAAEPPLLRAVGEILRELDARKLRMRPRVVLDGLPPGALPVEELTDVDVRTEGPIATAIPPWVEDRDTRARRLVWLAQPPTRRPGRRSHPQDRLMARGVPTSLVRLRDRQDVFALIDRLRDDRPLLARTDRFGLSLAGHFEDDFLQRRFATLCRQMREHVADHPPTGLTSLRTLAHALRRSMKPEHDGEDVSIQFGAEGPPDERVDVEPTDVPPIDTPPSDEPEGPFTPGPEDGGPDHDIGRPEGEALDGEDAFPDWIRQAAAIAVEPDAEPGEE